MHEVSDLIAQTETERSKQVDAIQGVLGMIKIGGGCVPDSLTAGT